MMKEVFPLPEGPQTATFCPFRIFSDMFFSIVRGDVLIKISMKRFGSEIPCLHSLVPGTQVVKLN